MKLTKSKLLKLVKLGMEKNGYVQFTDTVTGSQCLFIKTVSENLFLSTGLTISRYYDSLFTASFYFSQTTRWGSVWGDIPKDSYIRVSELLTLDERILLLSEEFHNATDAWWDASKQKDIDNFLKVICICEERFIGNTNLVTRIKRSADNIQLWGLAKKTKEVFVSNLFTSVLKFQPEKEVDTVPVPWFKAAETVLRSENFITNYNTVKQLALDSWRQNQLLK